MIENVRKEPGIWENIGQMKGIGGAGGRVGCNFT
jgi:hypothetical protein